MILMHSRGFWVALVGCLAANYCAQAQRPIAPGAEFKAAFDLLMNPIVQRELEIVDFQLEELEDIKVQRFRAISGLRKLVDDAPAESRAQMVSEFKAGIAKLDEQAIAVLLPHQRERLRQLALQSVVRPYGVRAGLHHERVIAELEIGADQSKAIADKSAEIEARVEKKVAELKEEIQRVEDVGRQQILATLNPIQRGKYEQLFGKTIDLSARK